MRSPLDGHVTISQGFGGNRYGEARDVPYGNGTTHVYGHTGLDMVVPVNTPVLAVWGGVVTHGDDPGGFGTYAVLLTDDGRTALYGHLSRYLTADQARVSAGQPIAASGNSGNSTGPHLHFEVRDRTPDLLNGYRGCHDPLPGFDHGVLANFDLSLF